MANERTYPCLPCRDLDEAIDFYTSLGFAKTYRQVRPNPYAVVAREDIHLTRACRHARLAQRQPLLAKGGAVMAATTTTMSGLHRAVGVRLILA